MAGSATCRSTTPTPSTCAPGTARCPRMGRRAGSRCWNTAFVPPAVSFVKEENIRLESCWKAPHAAQHLGMLPALQPPTLGGCCRVPTAHQSSPTPAACFPVSQHEFCPFLLVHAPSHPSPVAPSSPRTSPTEAKCSFYCTTCTSIASSALPYASKFHNTYKPTVQEPACPRCQNYPRPPQRSAAFRIKPSNLPHPPQRLHQITQTLVPRAGRRPHAALWAGGSLPVPLVAAFPFAHFPPIFNSLTIRSSPARSGRAAPGRRSLSSWRIESLSLVGKKKTTK